MLKESMYRNAAVAVTQVIITGVILIILYRYLLSTIGVEKLGIWSIVLAASSITRLGEAGFSGSVVRYVAKYVSLEQTRNTNDVIQTGALSAGAGVGIALLMIYPFVGNLLSYFVSDTYHLEALSVLPYAMLSLWISSITGAYQSGLDGFQRIDLRNVLLMVGGVLYLIVTIVLIPEHGFIGLGYAQVFQSVAMLVLNWYLLKRQFSGLTFLPRWRKDRFTEMWRYSFNFQFTSIAGMLFDPITKALLSKFGNLAMVGFYEMASRLVLQVRSMIVSANQVVVPVISGMNEKAPEYIKPMYQKSFDALLFFSVPMFAAVFSCMPLISELWIGYYEANFVCFTGILLVGWFANVVAAPAFFSNQGTGDLGWNTIGQVVIGAANLGLGIALGYLYQGIGVIVAWGIALIAGSVVVVASYHFRHAISIGALFQKANIRLALFSVSAVALCLFGYYQFHGLLEPITMLAATIAMFSIVVLPAIWIHPVRQYIWPFRRYETDN